MAKRGRPPIGIDKKIFENACFLQCTLMEMTSLFECSDDTINNWCKRTYGQNFSGVYKKYSAGGKMSLRRNQFKLSERSATMAIFLGKQYLNQRDIIEDTEDKARDGVLPELLEYLKDDKADN